MRPIKRIPDLTNRCAELEPGKTGGSHPTPFRQRFLSYNIYWESGLGKWGEVVIGVFPLTIFYVLCIFLIKILYLFTDLLQICISLVLFYIAGICNDSHPTQGYYCLFLNRLFPNDFTSLISLWRIKCSVEFVRSYFWGAHKGYHSTSPTNELLTSRHTHQDYMIFDLLCVIVSLYIVYTVLLLHSACFVCN